MKRVFQGIGKTFLPLALFLFLATALCGAEMGILRDQALTVFFEPSLGTAAQEVVNLYPGVKKAVESIFSWHMDVEPSVFIITNRKRFPVLSKSSLIVAFAVPERNLIVIDHAQMIGHPFTLETTLKHELCHLLLHHHISHDILPKWFDEGVCQWATDGIGEIMIEQKRSRLNRAAFMGSFIPLGRLQRHFPHDSGRMLLAYEESKSFVTYINGKFGKEAVLRILAYMKKGEDIHGAFMMALSTPLDELEEQWHQSLVQRMSWFTYVSYHLYGILFTFMALITTWAFIRLIMKKRAYMRDEDDTSFFDNM